MPPMPATDDSGLVLIQAVPTVDPSDPALGDTVDRLRADLPDSALVGGAAVENLDLKTQLDESTPLVIGVVLVLGFLLLLVALQAPLISLLGTLASLLSTAAAFGVARLIFQEGHGADLLGFESQGFLDAWAPVFFFAMIFAIAMDYTVFLLASAKEHYERSGDPHGRHGRLPGPLRPGDLRRRRRHGRGLLHLRPLRTDPAQGDGRRPRHRRPARRLPRPPRPAARHAPPHRQGRLVQPGLAPQGPAEHHLRPRLTNRSA